MDEDLSKEFGSKRTRHYIAAIEQDESLSFHAVPMSDGTDQVLCFSERDQAEAYLSWAQANNILLDMVVVSFTAESRHAQMERQIICTAAEAISISQGAERNVTVK